MLDLDQLAEKCARDLNEHEDHWRRVIWSADFQRVSQSMTDGEVENMVRACASSRSFEALIRFLIAHPSAGSESPYAIILAEAAKAGTSMRDWIKALGMVA